jgi:cob(I)alamin adenosyltransferase
MNGMAGSGPREQPGSTGDFGRTEFGSHGEVPKNDIRVCAYDECDAANAAISVAMAAGGLPLPITATLVSVQNDLFDLAADLSVPTTSPEPARARIIPAHTERLERAIDHFEQQVEDLSGMVLPGGTVAASLLYQARTAVRRAERTVWQAVAEHPDTVSAEMARYLNRLSTLLFAMSRAANAEHGDVLWIPESSVRAATENTGEEGSGAG